MGIKQEIEKRFTDTHIDLRVYWEVERRKIRKRKHSYVVFSAFILMWVPVVIIILPFGGWLLKALALMGFMTLIHYMVEAVRQQETPMERFVEIKDADRKSWHAQFNGWAYELAHQKIHVQMKKECQQITREGMQKIEEIKNAMVDNCHFEGSLRIDSVHRAQPIFEYDFSGMEGCQLRLYRQQGAMLESVEDVIEKDEAILIMQKYAPSTGDFIDYDAKDGQTYNYYAFLYFPVKTSRGEVVTTNMKLLYPESHSGSFANVKESVRDPSFITVLPKEFQANLAHGFMAERITVPKHITAEERAKFETKKLQAKNELRSMQDMLSFKSGDVVKRMKVVLKEITSRESRQKEIEAAIGMVIKSELSDAAKEKIENELLKLID